MSKNLIKKLEESFNSGILFEYVDNSFSHRKVLELLGFSAKGQYVGIVKEYLVSNEIDTKHFTANGKPSLNISKICPICGTRFSGIPSVINTQTVCSRACSNTLFRSGVNNGNFIDGKSNYREQALKHYKNACVICGFSNLLALEVHHKDHNRGNNNISNLEILCANCHKIHHLSTEVP